MPPLSASGPAPARMPMRFFPARQPAPTAQTQDSGFSPTALSVAAALWIATAGNLTLWSALAHLPEIQGWSGITFGFAFVLLVAALNAAFLSLCTWRRVLRPALVLILLTVAVTSHYMLSYNVVIDRAMILSALQTTPSEMHDVLSWRLANTVMLLGVLPALLIVRMPLRWPPVRKQARISLVTLVAALAVALGLAAGFYPAFSSTMRNHKELRYQLNPFNTLYALARLDQQPLPHNGALVQPIGLDAHVLPPVPGAHPPLVIVVLGETGREDRFGINGYARATTPQLAQLGVVSLRNVWSCGTYTAASVPCMFSPLGRSSFEHQKVRTEGLADVLRHAGYAVLWIDNQSGGCKGVCDRVPTVHAASLQAAHHCPSNEECPDGVLLDGLDARLAALPPDRAAQGVVIFLHQIGSHGPDYFKRSPAAFKKFLPECRINALQDCSTEEIGNAYDNTILFTDDVLARAIHWLQGHADHWAPALEYLADHGESLGEHNLYLHGLPYAIAPDEQKHVPWIFWLSSAFQRQTGITADCLRHDRDRRLSHDNFFHTTLGLLGVRTAVYNRDWDLTAGCDQRASTSVKRRPNTSVSAK